MSSALTKYINENDRVRSGYNWSAAETQWAIRAYAVSLAAPESISRALGRSPDAAYYKLVGKDSYATYQRGIAFLINTMPEDLINTLTSELGITQEKETMDKNIAALMIEGSRTVHVKFKNKDNYYVYLTDRSDIQVGSTVVVFLGGSGAQVGEVTQVDDDLMLEPNSTIKYSWIVGVVDTRAYLALQDKVQKIEELIRQGYQKTMRRSMADSVMQGLNDEAKADLTKLLSGD